MAENDDHNYCVVKDCFSVGHRLRFPFPKEEPYLNKWIHFVRNEVSDKHGGGSLMLGVGPTTEWLGLRIGLPGK